MNKFKILGEYKDWCEIYKDGTLIHNGSSLGIVSQVESELCLRLNYRTNKHFYSILKKFGDFILAVPKKVGFLKAEYKYEPIIFNKQEFDEFIDCIYVEEKLISSIPQLNKEDILNMWFLSNPLHKTYSNEMEMQENIINNILFFSDDEYDISCLKKVINKPDLSVHPIDSNYEVITIYMDGDAGMYDWDGIIIINNNAYLKVDKHYYMN
ncbi:hypothetical protein ACTNHA_001315 [Listeria monocytogenes]|nr:hypothetical protein [Listeria monocytogenes]